ncbi:ATP-binding cassette domain-containing protein [Plastoroseomonas arctica]|uniref:ATP-binding cassette domain-containing protein n=1 Tax=Plastoroseomonas arctica TaxID=1509237 RepID=A0AAF1JYL4_9PROT|nr:ATP-binding cassette domain-containing protein [Plastoroseomonas arctica]MBR0656782.1 ATP-binding cassette domain-containing protein [Plastoroseomonas arctica]
MASDASRDGRAAMPTLPAGQALAQLRDQAKTAIQLALVVGGSATLLTFATIWIKLEVFRLVVPTGSIPTALGLGMGFLIVAGLLVVLDHLRDLILLAAGNRLARAVSGPVILAAAARAGEPAAASGALLKDVEEVRRALAGPLCTALLDAALVPVALLLLWWLHPWFAVLAVVCCLLAAAASLLAEGRARGALASANALAARSAGGVADAMRCAEAVEAMGMRAALERRWRDDLRQGGERMRAAQELGRRLSASGATLQGLAAGGAMLVGALLSLRGEELGAGLMAAMLLTGRVIEPFARLGSATQDWGSATAAWARLARTMEQADEGALAGTVFACPEGRLVLERLTYLHPGTPRPLLREVDLTVTPGEVVAIIGPPGSGKTTLLRLMLGMFHPTAGGVFLDGHATSQWDHEDLARHVGYLPQDPNLGDGTIAEAIARLAIAPDLVAVLRAARRAGVDQMIASLPLGYATRVAGDSGLSMGQRQRVALARALYGDPRLVLLDEPTAWLDTQGEAAVEALLARLKADGVGVVLSSHRRGVVATADRVLVMGSAGTLREAGTPRAEPARIGAINGKASA